jgi:DNA-binding PadR family transcriptional regulator
VSESYKKEIVQHITRNLLSIQLLRLIQTHPLWGYKIKKEMETKFDVKIRHGVLYPTLNSLERRGFLKSEKQKQAGRARKVYSVTQKGKEYIETYYSILREQIDLKDIK